VLSRVSSLVVLFFIFFSLFLPLILPAQTTNASLTGRVTDPLKARIADAKVAAINVATNTRVEVTTNAVGEYYLPSLLPGTYRIEAEKAGFKKLVRPDVILHVQDALDIDFEMTVGSAAESITVEGGAPLMNTESATVSTVVDHAFIDRLPLNGRTFQNLILLTPGVVLTSASLADQGTVQREWTTSRRKLFFRRWCER
jgi:Carboxypeptidase regulatory-like domain